MTRSFLIAAFHAYAAGALLYLVHLARPSRALAIAARISVAIGFVCHGVMLWDVFFQTGGVRLGLRARLTGLSFLLVGIALGVDLRYRAPVMGAFLVPPGLLVLSPVLFYAGVLEATPGKPPLLPVHIAVALLGLAVFGIAAGVACLYLILE